jgi:hypothetical protein
MLSHFILSDTVNVETVNINFSLQLCADERRIHGLNAINNQNRTYVRTYK